MTLVVCPRCKAPNDAPADANGRQRCMICNHMWLPQVSINAAVPAAAPATASPPAPPQPAASTIRPARPKSTRVSQEYLPDDPANEAGRALTTRQHAEGSVEKRQASEQGRDAAAELKPHSDRSHGGVIPPLKSLPSKEDPADIQVSIDLPPSKPLVQHNRQPMQQPRVTPSTPTVEVDMDLFDRLEKEAQLNRSKQRTVAELTFEPPSAANATPSNGQTMACPVCGHTFVATSSARAQTCPQCHTTFDHASGRFATASSGANGGDPLIGRNLKGCVIDRKLGEGGMGSVYHAKQLSLDRSVAIKVLPPDLARNRNFIQRFEREAKSLAKINHPNILHIYDFGEEGSLKLYFMIIEFVDGTDLGEVLNRRTTLPQLEVLDLLRQAAMGLEMAAAKGVIHRDIKPDNLMIAGDGLCKVSDFGLAKGYGDENEVTSIGVRVGTPAFMSPEQCDGVEVDWRSDVYNLGCTAFLALTGRLPFDGETPFSIMLKHKNDPIPSVREVSPSVEQSVDNLVRRMLAKKPADRCDSWKAMIDEIEDIEGQLAGDPNAVSRKSRGQLQALGQRPAVPPMTDNLRLPPVSNMPSVSSSTPMVQAAGAKTLPEWLKPVDVPAAPVPAGASVQQSRSSNRQEAVPAATVVTATPRTTTSSSNHRTLSPDAAGRSSRKLNAELVAAKDRGLRSEAEALAASAERLFNAGRFVEAAKDFRKASDLTPDTEFSGVLYKRAREAGRRGRWKRITMRLVLFLVVLALLAAAVFWATPVVHNLLATRQKQDIQSQFRDAAQRDAALMAFAQAQKPYDWYTATFQHGYTLSAVTEAQAEVDEDERNAQPTVPATAVDSRELTALEAGYNDPSVSFPELADRAATMLKTVSSGERQRVHDVLLHVQANIDELTPLLHQIEALIAKGKTGAALAMARDFRTNHPRAGRLAADLPLPSRLMVETEDGRPIDAAVQSDGILLPPGERQLCRRADRDVVVQIAAPGYGSQTISLTADATPDETLVNVKLKTAPLWTRSLGHGLGGRAQLHLAPNGVYVQREDGMALLRATDGLVLGTLEPLAGIQGPSYTPLWNLDPSGSHIIVGGVEGMVEMIDARSMQPQQLLFQGKADVLSWIEVPLAFKAGQNARYLVEESHGNRRLVALDGAQEWWHYQSIPGSQPPYLSTALDKLVVIDDTIIHLIDEDGSNDSTTALSAPRSGAVLSLPRDLGVLVPTTGGVSWVRFGPAQQPVVVSDDAALLAAGPGAIASSGTNVVIVHVDGLELLSLDGDHFVSRWKTPLDTQAVEIGMNDSVVAISDSKQRLVIFSVATGAPLARIALPAPLAASPMVLPNAVVVDDSEGNVASYLLRLP